MHRIDAYRVIRRCAAEAGFSRSSAPTSSRATGITVYLEAVGTLGKRSGRGGA